MKRIKIEFQVTLLTAIVVAAVVFSGYLVYQSLSQIVGSIHREARPDFKLLQIKDIASDLTQVENTVRLYTITRDEKYFHPFKETNESIQDKLDMLKDYSLTSYDEKIQIDSIRNLTNSKLAIWEEIMALHQTREEAHESFSALYNKIDSTQSVPDTVIVEVEVPEETEQKKGFLKRLFGGKKKEAEPDTIEQMQLQPVDTTTIEKETIKLEIAQIEKRIESTNRAISAKEKALLEKNIELTTLLNEQINTLENNERKKLLAKTQEADRLAAITYKRLAFFTIGAIILLLLVLFLFFRYLNKSRAYQSILRDAKTDAEKLARAKELFVATVSHEMRTPINAIYGLTEQLLKKTEDPKRKQDLEIIYNSTEHLISLVNDTLDFSKIESQKLKLDKVDFSLDKLLGEVITLNKGNAKRKNLQLNLDTKNLPPLILLGDAFRLKQILINLMNNAIKFTDSGSVTLRAFTERGSSDEPIWVSFQVLDTGIGISKENHSLIFDDFVQLETDLTKKQGGAGLGLSIVKKLVNIQGGNISVNSEPNKGTMISLEIPYEKGNPAKIKIKKQEEIIIPGHFSNLSVLIVDDEDFNRYLLKSILQKWNINVTEKVNGQEAVDICRSEHFDLIFMDVRMPVLNGLEASQQILTQSTDTKIVALTATSKSEDIEKCKEAGMHNFLSKPFSEKDLFSTLQETISIENTPVQKKKEISQAQSIPSIDLSELERMADGNQSFVIEMIEIFIRSSENGLKEIRKNLRLKNWELISECAHKMAAPAKHMKALSLYSKIKEIEQEAELAQNEQKINLLYKEVEQEIKMTNSYLKNVLKNNS